MSEDNIELDAAALDIKINLLKKSRSGHKGRITYFKNKFAQNEYKSIGELQSVLHRIRLTYEKFDVVQSALEGIDPAEIDSEDKFIFEDDYGMLDSAVLDKIHSIENKSKLEFYDPNLNINKVNKKNVETSVAIRLPQISLPKFDGTELTWLNFRDIFVDLIHSNDSISFITKFHYLISSLRNGKAYHLIENLPITNDNYNTAWKIVFDHYNNEISIQKLHVKNLYDIKRPQENSASSLQFFVESAEKHYNALKSLKVNVETWNLILTHHLMEKLDSPSRIEIVKNSPLDKLLGFSEFMEILKKRVKILEVLVQAKGTTSSATKSIPYKLNTNRVFVSNNLSSSCPVCKENHTLNLCPKFCSSNWSPLKRYELVKQLKLCTNCLSSIHRVFDCKAEACKRCSLRHHTLLHFEKTNSSVTSECNQENPMNVFKNNSSNSNVASTTIASSVDSIKQSLQSSKKQSTITQVLLATAVVWVESSNGRRIQCRALLDSGSQSNYITENLCQIIKPIKKSTSIKVSGINEKFTEVKHIVNVNIQSRISDYKTKLDCLVLSKITGELPSCSFPFDPSTIPKNITLADPKFFISHKIDMLIGAEKYNEIVDGVAIKVVSELPPLQNTQLGFIVLGKILNKNAVEPSLDTFINMSTSLTSSIHEDLNNKISKFWELEQLHLPNDLSMEEKMCEEHYIRNVRRLPCGRYSVALPVKANILELNDNKISAFKQYQYLENRLVKNPELHIKYKAFMKEYIDLNHMQLIKNPENFESQYEKIYFVPHHAVFKESSTTTKLRVVFNASSKSNTNISLNDCLMTGPTIQQDLFSIMVRFRKYLFALSADITKMYRQIRIHENDRDLLRLYWRESLNDEIKCYRLCTVTYGTSSAPFQAIRTLKQLSSDERNNFPLASKVLEKDFYVDDVLSGTNSFEEAQRLKQDLTNLLAKGGFELRKWHSNCKNLSDTTDFDPTSDNSISLLGLHWNPESDNFKIILRHFADTTKFTKRVILSEIAQLFDPLGLCAPVIVTAKLIMQSLWTTPNLLWDDEVPSSISDAWSSFRRQLPSIYKLNIPRCVFANNIKSIELHGFGDAAEKAYGCVIYIRVTDLSNVSRISLLCAKSRIAPLKRQSIPRLELCAAVLLAQLADKVIKSMEIEFNRICLWSDSEITVLRIKSCPSKFATFVANRISLIQDLSSVTSWMYVPTSVNPADLISRGLMPTDIITSKLWWNGPSFLESNSCNWPKSSNVKISPDLLELKKGEVSLHTRNTALSVIEKYSDTYKLIRVLALCVRFYHNLQPKKYPHISGEVTTTEVEAARIRILKIIQHEAFASDIMSIRKHKMVQRESKLKSFNPFLDENDLLRVGGRLNNVDVCVDKKHQIILPAANTFTKNLVRKEHQRQLHAGPQALLYSLRAQYWIIGGRNLCRKVVHECIRCFRSRPSNIKQIMGQLPAHRVTPSRAFLNVGIDFCGPFNMTHNLRRKVTTKVYVAVFICFCTKAVHLEIVDDLSTQAFLASFRRFVARRGKCVNVYSDNATNFVGANAELKVLHDLFTSAAHKNAVTRYFAEERIQWHYIPPRSPHFGGLWEAAVKSAKHHLKRVVGNSLLRYEEFHTLITQIEACLNSRPLTPMSSDVLDLEVLTPGHFVIGSALTTLDDSCLNHLDFNRLSRWQRLQFMFQQFWKRWQLEYLSELQQRRKWLTPSENVTVGSLVLLKEDNIPPLRWPMGRITELHVGNDGYVRVVTVKTANSEFKRAISKICVLPMEDCSTE